MWACRRRTFAARSVRFECKMTAIEMQFRVARTAAHMQRKRWPADRAISATDNYHQRRHRKDAINFTRNEDKTLHGVS